MLDLCEYSITLQDNMSKTHASTERFWGEEAPKMTKEEYSNLQKLMVEFCKLPLLENFYAPATKQFPQLAEINDLGRICRRIAGGLFTSTRDVRRDVCLMLANFINFHLRQNRHNLVYYVAIGNHMRMHFDVLWLEFMIPSDLPDDADQFTVDTHEHRRQAREQQLLFSGGIILNDEYRVKSAELIEGFISRDGRVDHLDTKPLWSGRVVAGDRRFKSTIGLLKEAVESLKSGDATYSIADTYTRLLSCGDSLEKEAKKSFGNRITRLLWKRYALLHEANRRGTETSSVYGKVIDVFWCRETKKKPYLPCLKLGVRDSQGQTGSADTAVTNHNLSLLPPQYRHELEKKYQSISSTSCNKGYPLFLVEYVTTHQLDWVPHRLTLPYDDEESQDTHHVICTQTKYKNALKAAKTTLGELRTVLVDAMCDYEGGSRETMTRRAKHSYQSLIEMNEDDDDGDKNDSNAADNEFSNVLLSTEGGTEEGNQNDDGRQLSRKRSSKDEDGAVNNGKKSRGSNSGSERGRSDQNDRDLQKVIEELTSRLTALERNRGDDRAKIKELEIENAKLASRLDGLQETSNVGGGCEQDKEILEKVKDQTSDIFLKLIGEHQTDFAAQFQSLIEGQETLRRKYDEAVVGKETRKELRGSIVRLDKRVTAIATSAPSCVTDALSGLRRDVEQLAQDQKMNNEKVNGEVQRLDKENNDFRSSFVKKFASCFSNFGSE
ncbi:hypothetical protein MPSEU_000751500 [Mayamaea pseudoterrestris]|nr:hypothetical protein MPSEU_000751500 [Mayamaea pseudoterrestris]